MCTSATFNNQRRGQNVKCTKGINISKVIKKNPHAEFAMY